MISSGNDPEGGTLSPNSASPVPSLPFWEGRPLLKNSIKASQNQDLKMKADSNYLNKIRRFQRNLRALRLARGLKQHELGELTDIDGAYISELENLKKGVLQNPSYKIICRLAEGLDCNISELIGEKIQIKIIF